MTKILLCLTMVFSVSTTAWANVILDQNFDSTTAFPADTYLEQLGRGNATTTAGAWNAETTDPRDPYVTGDQSHSSGQSLRFTRSVTTSNIGVIGNANTGSPLTGVVEGSAWFYQTSADAGFWFVVSNRSLRASALSNISVYSLNGRIMMNGTKTPSTGTVSAPISQWYGLRVVLDLSDQVFNTFIDTGSGWTLIDENRTFTLDTVANQTYGGVNAIWVRAQGAQNSTFYLDDANIHTVVPEPATGLILLAGLALTGCRRRWDQK